MKYLLGVDLGTTAIKAGLFAENGELIHEATENYDLMYPAPNFVEQTPEVYWKAFCIALKKIVSHANKKEDIVALSLSAQGETIVPIDRNGNPLQNFIVWLDNRAQAEAEYLAERFDSKHLHQITGQAHMIALSPGAKILWIRRNRPEIFKKAYKFLLIEDYFFYRLAGVFKAEGSLWCTSHLLDINNGSWWPEMMEELGIDENQLPQLFDSGSPIGTIIPEVADEISLPHHLLLVMGGLDQACGAIGVGNVRPGIFSESTGAALVTCTMTDHIVLDEDGTLPCFYSAIPGIYMIHAFSSGGIAYKWLRDALCEDFTHAEETGEIENAYVTMDELAAGIPAASEGVIVLPHFNGSGPPDCNQYAKCVIWGLGLHHKRAHIIRAFMESIAVNIERMIAASENLLDIKIDEIRSMGGGAMSSLWCQIKSDITGIPVVTMKNTQDSACLGAMILAGVGAGLFDSVGEAAERFTLKSRRFEPNQKNRKIYDSLLSHYDELTKTIKPITKKF